MADPPWIVPGFLRSCSGYIIFILSLRNRPTFFLENESVKLQRLNGAWPVFTFLLEHKKTDNLFGVCKAISVTVTFFILV